MTWVLLGAIGSAWGQQPAEPAGSSVSFAEDFELRYWTLDQRLPDPADVAVFDYVEQVNRLNMNATAGKWAFAAQVDQVTLWLDRYWLNDELFLERDLTAEGLPNVFPGRAADTAYLNLEKVRATLEDQWGLLTLGDSYVAFGRGAALNMNRNVDIDIDSSIQGAKAVFRPGAWDLSLVVGQANRQQVWQDNPNRDLRGDLRHFVTGFRAERFGLGPANLGAHVVGFDFVDEAGFAAGFQQLEPFDAVVGGVTAEVIGVGGIDGYLEADLYGYGPNQPSPLGPDVGDLGHAVYASASAYPGPFVVLVEGKRYYQAERVNATLSSEQYEVAVAPTLEYERVVTEDSSAALNSNDVYGGKVQVDWAAVPGKLVPYVSLAAFRDLDLSGLHFNDTPETIVHPLAGVEWIDGGYAVLLNGGYRLDDRDGDTAGTDRQAHVDLTLNLPLPAELDASIAIAAERYQWGVNPLQQSDYVESETGTTLTWRHVWSGTAFVDYTTNPLVNTTGNVGEQLYLAGELQFKPTSAWTLKAFYGSQKAGIRCSGGQCRQLPGFEGARVSAVGTF
ncbi:MAG: hypothetical protein ABMA64_00095 [Myxococcota bacterium]